MERTLFYYTDTEICWLQSKLSPGGKNLSQASLSSTKNFALKMHSELIFLIQFLSFSPDNLAFPMLRIVSGIQWLEFALLPDRTISEPRNVSVVFSELNIAPKLWNARSGKYVSERCIRYLTGHFQIERLKICFRITYNLLIGGFQVSNIAKYTVENVLHLW